MTLRSAEGDDVFPVDEAVARRVMSEGVPVSLSGGAEPVLSIKDGETYFVSAPDGDLDLGNTRGLGLYHGDTRFLSVAVLRVGGARPVLLSASAERGYMAQVDLTNPDLWDGDDLTVPQQTVSIRRARVVGRRVHERIRVKNHATSTVVVSLELTFGADFADILEVRGLRRTLRGTLLRAETDERSIVFAYLGADDLFRRTRITFGRSGRATVAHDGTVVMVFDLPLRPQQTQLVGYTVDPLLGEEPPPGDDFDVSLHKLRRSYEDWDRTCTRIRTDNVRFDRLLDRSRRDLRALRTSTDDGGYLATGIPWYVAPMGRAALWAAYESLSLTPELARDALRTFASTQGQKDDPTRDEEPGKIIHEKRSGELAYAGIVPHDPYYGSVDATPLYVMLAAAHLRWSGDRELVTELLPSIRAALSWIDDHGDLDGDGFVEYRRRAPRGLENQGWKDSGAAIVHEDGTLAEPPIALVEVQGYVYMAKLRAAELFALEGDAATADRLRAEARELAVRFDEAFWMPEEGYYALALDGGKRQVRTITSNPGHLFYCGIIPEERAEQVARRLLRPDLFSGWGIRTMSRSAAAYNPMSYHNGSVWPHDNALIAAGLKRYGLHDATNRIVTAMFETASQTRYMRLPELFCGFTRRSPNSPVAYPVACSPHAPAAASAFILLQAMLGISARAHENLLTVNAPSLPSWLQTVEIRDLRVGASTISMLFTREGDVTSFSLLSKDGDVRVVMEE